MKVYEDLIAAIEEMICTSTAVMAPYPVDVVGRPAPFGKLKSKKKSHGEKRAPHTEIHEEYEKQVKGNEKSAMYKYSYKKNGQLRKSPLVETIEEIANMCNNILEYSGDHSNPQPHNKALNKIKDELAILKSRRRRAKKDYPAAEKSFNSARAHKLDDVFGYLQKGEKLDKLAADRWDNDEKINDLVSRRNKLQNLKGLNSPKNS
jgi:hypothetical protein